MKKIFCACTFLITSFNLVNAFELDNPASPECPTVCHKTHMSAPGLGSICYDNYLCNIYELNESTGKCEKVGENEMKLPVFCRDVPPAF